MTRGVARQPNRRHRWRTRRERPRGYRAAEQREERAALHVWRDAAEVTEGERDQSVVLWSRSPIASRSMSPLEQATRIGANAGSSDGCAKSGGFRASRKPNTIRLCHGSPLVLSLLSGFRLPSRRIVRARPEETPIERPDCIEYSEQ